MVVSVSLGEVNQMIFRVCDEGCGISPEHLERIQKVISQDCDSECNEW